MPNTTIRRRIPAWAWALIVLGIVFGVVPWLILTVSNLR
jgi:hypothetical protein